MRTTYPLLSFAISQTASSEAIVYCNATSLKIEAVSEYYAMWHVAMYCALRVASHHASHWTHCAAWAVDSISDGCRDGHDGWCA